ncbi:MAG: hypothetical protein Kow0065_15860 [Methylomicrobium sp.]
MNSHPRQSNLDPTRFISSWTQRLPFALAIVVGSLLSCWAYGAQNRHDEPLSRDAEDSDSDAERTLTIDTDTQNLIGLKTRTLVAYRYRPERVASGSAVSVQPLLDLRNRYLSAMADRQSVRTRLSLALQNLERARLLHRSGVVSAKNLQELQLQWQSERALEQAARLQIEAIRNEALLNWGQSLADGFLGDDSAQLSAYVSGRKKLLLVTLPSGSETLDKPDPIRVSRTGHRDQAMLARFISKAPQTDVLIQGESYFFETEQDDIRTGMRVTVFIPSQQDAVVGVLIPASAMLRHLGQNFVYLKTTPNRFHRVRLTAYIDTPDGYFVESELSPGQEVVEVGAQMLLSEEFRGQIPDEDDD